jgi:adenylylsulfate kinase
VEVISKGGVVWVTGLPASGKTTLASRIHAKLLESGVAVLWLDSDALRAQIMPNVGYSDEERDTFYNALIYIASEAMRGGVLVLISATGSKADYRTRLSQRTDYYVELYLECSQDERQSRDPKGLYAQAKSGEVEQLPGVGVPFEEPSNPDLHLLTDRLSVEQCEASAITFLQTLPWVGLSSD